MGPPAFCQTIEGSSVIVEFSAVAKPCRKWKRTVDRIDGFGNFFISRILFLLLTARKFPLAERSWKPEIGGTHGGERGLRGKEGLKVWFGLVVAVTLGEKVVGLSCSY